MSELPKGWVELPLEHVASWGSGGTPKRSEPSYYGGDVPWVKTGDLGPRYLKEASEYISQLGLEKSSAKLFPKGSVAIAMYGATIGKTSTLDFEASTNQACAVGNPIDGVILTDFLYYFLTSEKQNFIKKGKGGAQPNISQQLIKAHEIQLPSLAEQKRIVEKLDEVLAQVDTIKARLDGIPAILKRFRQSVLASAVSGKLTEEWRCVSRPECVSDMVETVVENNSHKAKPYEPSVPQYAIDPTWQWCRLGDIFTLKSGKTIKASEEKEEGTIPYYKVGDMNDPENQFYMSKADKFVGDSVSKKSLLPANTIIFPKRGGAIGTNKKRILSVESLVDLNTMGIIVPVEFEMKYFYRWFETIDLGSLNTGSTIPQVNNGDIEPLWVPVPSVKEQKEIVRLVDQYFAFADTVEAQVKKAQARVDNLTQSILAKAFRGELVAQDPNDEPADKLLERIAQARKEAEALAKAAKKTEAAKKRTAKSV